MRNVECSLARPRSFCVSAVIGHRIFVIGGENADGNLDSVEYLDFAEERNDDTLSTVISFSSAWTTHSDLVLSDPRYSCGVVAVGSCLVVAGGSRQTVEVLDAHHNRVWNLPPLGEGRLGCSMVTVANQVAVISGEENLSCTTLPLMDRNSWCFHRLFEQQLNGWYHSLECKGIRDVDISPFSMWTPARKRARPNTRQNDKGNDET